MVYTVPSRSFRHQVAQSREDRAERGGTRERAQRRRFHPGAPRRRRVQRQRLSVGERVRQRRMGRAGEQSGVTQLPAVRRHRCHCLLGKRLTFLSILSCLCNETARLRGSASTFVRFELTLRLSRISFRELESSESSLSTKIACRGGYVVRTYDVTD